MKRFFPLVLSLLLLCGCTVQVRFAGASLPDVDETLPAQPVPVAASAPSVPVSGAAKEEIRAVWVSYTELNPEKLQNEAAFRSRVQKLLSPLRALSVTEVFLQVRPFADAIYPSKLFASSGCVVRRRGDPLPFDFLSVFLAEAEKIGLHTHAWINPYRVSGSEDSLASFSFDPAVGPLLKKNGAPCVIAWDGGIYLDPASADVQDLIVRGVRELMETYDLAGVHIDDYFYPTAAAAFDAQRYAAYCAGGGKENLLSFRRSNVTRLLQRLYGTVKSFGSEKVFSVSPSADIEKNESVCAADVRLWGSEDGCCDWLIPQIYFGFRHETRPFADCAQNWRSLCKNEHVRLLGGLAAYKIGKEDPFAGSGSTEWKRSTTLLGEQVQTLRRTGYDGFALFSASFLNFDKKLSGKVLKNLKDVI